MAELSNLRHAISALLQTSGDRGADAWLISFQASAGSWQLCLRLLNQPDCSQEELWFAANAMRTCFQRAQDVTELSTLQLLLPHMAQILLTATSSSNWGVVTRLSSALATLCVRAPSWEPTTMLQGLQQLLMTQQQQQQASCVSPPSITSPTGRVGGTASLQELQALIMGQSSAAGGLVSHQQLTQMLTQQHTDHHQMLLQWQDQQAAVAAASQQQQGQRAVVQLTALLHVLAALPEAAMSRTTAVHASRRAAVVAALIASPVVAEFCHSALTAGGGRQLELLTLRVLQEWCILGSAPASLEHHPELSQCVCAAVLLLPGTTAPAAECLAALLKASGGAPTAAVIDPSDPLQLASAGSLDVEVAAVAPKGPLLQAPLLIQLLEHWLDAAAAGDGKGQAGLAPHHSLLSGPEVQVARCSVFCTAGTVLLPLALAGPALLGMADGKTQPPVIEQRLLELLGRVEDELLDCIGCSLTEVTLVALNWWHDTYLAALIQAAANPAGVGVIDSAASFAAARQQLQAQLAGPPQLLVPQVSSQQRLLERLVVSLVARMQLMPEQAAVATADARDLQEDVRTVRRELASVLRDITSLVGHFAMLKFIAAAVRREMDRLNQQPANGPDSGERSSGGSSTGSASSASNEVAWPCLESCIYAANVVVGRMNGDMLAGHAGANAALQQLLDVSSACIVHPKGSLKLSGSALTLLGNLSRWSCHMPSALPCLLAGLEPALRSTDERLARNAATNLHKLTGHAPLARRMLVEHQAWVEAVLQLLNEHGGVIAKSSPGDDQSTEEFLLASLCRVAAASPQLPASASLLFALARPKADQMRLALLELLELQRQTSTLANLAQKLQQGGLNFPGSNPNMWPGMDGAMVQGGGGVAGGGSAAAAAAGVRQAAGHYSDAQYAQLASRVTQCIEVLTLIVTSSVPQDVGSAEADAARAGLVGKSPSMHLLDLIGQLWEVLGQGLGVAAQLQPAVAPAGGLIPGHMSPSAHGSAGSAGVRIAAMTCSFLCACLAAVSTEQSGGFSLLQGCATLLLPLPSGLLASPAALALLSSCVRSVASAPAAWAGRAKPRLAELVSTAVMAACPKVLAAVAMDHAGAGFNTGNGRSSQQGNGSSGNGHHGHHHGGSSASAAGGDIGGDGFGGRSLAQALFSLVSACASSLPAAFTFTADMSGSALSSAAAGGGTGHLLMAMVPAAAMRVLNSLLAVTVTCCRSSHLEQCRALLDWVADFAVATYQGPVGSGVAKPEWAAWLDAGAGTRLVLALMLAAAGDMPADLVLPISACVHTVWCAAGDARFRPWLELAIGPMTPPRAPWARLRPDARAAFVADLLQPACVTDVPRFKRCLKSFCYGKKKGGGGGGGGGGAGRSMGGGSTSGRCKGHGMRA